MDIKVLVFKKQNRRSQRPEICPSRPGGSSKSLQWGPINPGIRLSNNLGLPDCRECWRWVGAKPVLFRRCHRAASAHQDRGYVIRYKRIGPGRMAEMVAESVAMSCAPSLAREPDTGLLNSMLPPHP